MTGNLFDGYVRGTPGTAGTSGRNDNEPFYARFLNRNHKGRKHPRPR